MGGHQVSHSCYHEALLLSCTRRCGRSWTLWRRADLEALAPGLMYTANSTIVEPLNLPVHQALRKELDAVAAGGDPEALAAMLLHPVNPKFCMLKPYQALRKELDAVAAGGDLEALAAGDGGLSAGTFGANHDAANEVGLAEFSTLNCASACAASWSPSLIMVTLSLQGAAGMLSCLHPAVDARRGCAQGNHTTLSLKKCANLNLYLYPAPGGGAREGSAHRVQ